jgi:hypothetical protein
MKGRQRSLSPTFHLSFLNHVHQLDATQHNARAVKILEPQRRPGDAIDGPMGRCHIKALGSQ